MRDVADAGNAAPARHVALDAPRIAQGGNVGRITVLWRLPNPAEVHPARRRVQRRAPFHRAPGRIAARHGPGQKSGNRPQYIDFVNIYNVLPPPRASLRHRPGNRAAQPRPRALRKWHPPVFPARGAGPRSRHRPTPAGTPPARPAAAPNGPVRDGMGWARIAPRRTGPALSRAVRASICGGAILTANRGLCL